jgi:hypothetical protein
MTCWSPGSAASKVAASVYPDSDKIAIWTGNDTDDLILTRTGSVGYWEGETREATS